MNQSTKDESHISQKEFTILREIVKGLSDPRAKASLESATESYTNVLNAHNISVQDDKIYFGALLRLNHYEGESWAEKLLGAAAHIERELKSVYEPPTRHRRYKSTTDHQFMKRDANNRSVLQQKLDRSHQLQTSALVDLFESKALMLPLKEAGPPILTQEAKYALVERYKLFIRTHSDKTARKVMQFWREATRYMQDVRIDQWDWAIDADHKMLKHQAFEIWHDAFYSHIEAHQDRARKVKYLVCKKFYRRWENRVIARREGQYLAKVRAEKRALFDALLLKNRKKFMCRTLRSWRAAARKWQRLSTRALILRDKRTQLVIWKSWFFKTCELKTAAVHAQKKLHRAFHFWLARLHHLQIMDHNALAKRTEDVLIRAWDVWRANYAESEAAKELAEEFNSKNTRDHYILKWRATFQIAVKVRRVQDQIDSRMLMKCLALWRQRRNDQAGLYLVAENARLRSLFISWKMESKATRFARESDFNLIRSTFGQWSIEARGRMLRNEIDFRVAKRTFSHWSYRLVILQDRLESCEDQFLTISNTHLTKAIMHAWHDKLVFLKNKYDTADIFYHRTISSSAIATWLERRSERRLQVRKATDLEKINSNKKVYHIWFERLVSKKMRDREEKLKNFCARSDKQVAHRALACWRAHNDQYEESNHLATDLFLDRSTEMQRYFFTAWNDRHLGIFEMERIAYDHERYNAATFLYNALRDKLERRVRLAREADDIWGHKIHNQGLYMLRGWHRRYLRILEKERQADLWAYNFDQRRLRTFFRRWKAGARARGRSVHSRTYVGDTSSESFNASRTRVDWNDGTTVISRRNRLVLG